MNCQDADLKTLAISDRAAAFDALVRQTRPRLVRHARSIVHDPDLASDIVQDVLIKAMREPRLFDADFRPAAWLYRVTTNPSYARGETGLTANAPDFSEALAHSS